MRRADRRTIDEIGLPGPVLMENAGAAVVRALDERNGPARRVAVLCGRGNNGGDGFVVARRLGRRATALLLGSREGVSGEARVHLGACERSGVRGHRGDGPGGLGSRGRGDRRGRPDRRRGARDRPARGAGRPRGRRDRLDARAARLRRAGRRRGPPVRRALRRRSLRLAGGCGDPHRDVRGAQARSRAAARGRPLRRGDRRRHRHLEGERRGRRRRRSSSSRTRTPRPRSRSAAAVPTRATSATSSSSPAPSARRVPPCWRRAERCAAGRVSSPQRRPRRACRRWPPPAPR